MQDIIKEEAEFFVEDTHMNSEKVLTEGHMIPFNINNIDKVLEKERVGVTDKLKESFSFNDNHCSFLEMYKEDSIRTMMDNFMKNL